MRFLAVDDEKLVLSRLLRALECAQPGSEIRSFTRVHEALAALTEQGFRPDAAFLDVEMPGLSGIELAKRIRELSPATKIIFVTGHSQYAVDAYALHARGYLMKPVTAERIEEELRELRAPEPTHGPQNVRLEVRCFGNFEVSAGGVPLLFSRSKSKELLAYLIHKRGSACTVKELAAILFEDRLYDVSMQNYMQKIISALVKTLKEAGAGEIIVKRYNSLAVDPDKFGCDLYRFFRLDAEAVNTYAGEYMAQYSWAEFTVGYLDQCRR